MGADLHGPYKHRRVEMRGGAIHKSILGCYMHLHIDNADATTTPSSAAFGSPAHTFWLLYVPETSPPLTTLQSQNTQGKP